MWALGEVISEEYSLEYGTDKMEMHVGAVQAGDRALVIDDLIATGGTLAAAMRLLGGFISLSPFFFHWFSSVFWFFYPKFCLHAISSISYISMLTSA